MGNRNISNKEQKKKKKTEPSSVKPSLGTVVQQPEVIKKQKKVQED